MTIIYIIVGALAVVILSVVLVYNKFVALTNRVKEAWSGIDVQLKRRYDLIPNLVNAVKGYATHESTVFEQVTQARTRAMGAGAPAAKSAAENGLAGALKSLFAVSEAYPELKANQNFLSLQAELSDTEDKIQAARRIYNGNVRDLNTAVDSFPGNLVAGMFSFAKQEFFGIDEGSAAAKEPVTVKF